MTKNNVFPSGKSKRKNVRLNFQRKSIRIAYKFLSSKKETLLETVYVGILVDLSKGGAQIFGVIPDLTWAPKFASGDILLGCNLVLEGETIKALCRVRWLGSTYYDEKKNLLHRMGLEFIEIEEKHRTNLNKFLIRNQIKASKAYKREELLLNPKIVGD
jgi:c-di-GMP-binding flagellar brake protein YcgR